MPTILPQNYYSVEEYYAICLDTPLSEVYPGLIGIVLDRKHCAYRPVKEHWQDALWAKGCQNSIAKVSMRRVVEKKYRIVDNKYLYPKDHVFDNEKKGNHG